jgi:hypothetical protein
MPPSSSIGEGVAGARFEEIVSPSFAAASTKPTKPAYATAAMSQWIWRGRWPCRSGGRPDAHRPGDGQAGVDATPARVDQRLIGQSEDLSEIKSLLRYALSRK